MRRERAGSLAAPPIDRPYRLAFDEAPVGMALIGLHGPDAAILLRVNRALCALTGYREEQLIGCPVQELHSAEGRAETLEALAALASGERTRFELERRYRHASGVDLWAHVLLSAARRDDGTPAYAIATVQDVSAQKQAEARLTHQALHDPLTGLPNRTVLMDQLARALRRAARLDRRVGVLFLDLDDFKLVNDSLGHAAGDDLLVEVARRLGECLRGADTVARLGGDEFVVVCEEIYDADELKLVVKRIERALMQEFWLHGTVVSLRASIGVAISTNGSTAEGLLGDADRVMYRAKAAGKGRHAIADPELEAEEDRRARLHSGLEAALGDQRLRLEYQPCFDLESGKMVAVEALLRWDHPDRGALSADAFLDAVEGRDLMVDLGGWVIRAACAQAGAWHREFGDRAPIVFVNVSGRQLGSGRLTASVADALAANGLPPSKIVLELNERQLVATTASAREDLDGVHRLGVGLAVDDFGSAHQGVSYLRELPVGSLKIDPALVAGLGSNQIDTALTSSIATLAHGLDLTVVAEGVETSAQHQQLKELGCDFAQGYLLGAPGAPELVGSLLS